MYSGYDFYIDGVRLPITPPSLNITIGSNNKTVQLINEGEINILKSPKLIEVSFDARFPMRSYPYAEQPRNFTFYFDKFKNLKANKRPFQFIVARATPAGNITWDTNLTMAIEGLSLKESHDEGDDVIVSFTLRQWKSYGAKVVQLSESADGKPVIQKGGNNAIVAADLQDDSYTVRAGDTLYTIAKKMYGDGSKWRDIYSANKGTIEDTAKSRGYTSSRDGHWIFPNTTLKIPR